MKVSKQFFFAIVTLNIFLSCNSRSNKFEMIQSRGLDADNLGLKSVLFSNRDTGFIVGSSDKVSPNPNIQSDTFAFVKRTALIYRTIDGGKSWIAKDFGEGSFQNIISINKFIYAFKISEKDNNTKIYCSNNFGETWEKEISFPNIVTNLFFINKLFVLIAKDENRIFQFYISKDEGQHWIKKTAPYLPIYDIILSGNQLFYLSSNIKNEYQKNLLVRYNIEDDFIKIIELPKYFDCYLLYNNNNKIKLCGKKDNNIAVYSFINDKLQYEYSTSGNDSMNFPVGFYDFKNENYLIIGSRRNEDVVYHILKTTDNGRFWETINFTRDNHINPFCFINEGNKVKAWFYAGSGRFQILE